MPEKLVMPGIYKDSLLSIYEIGVTVVSGRIKPKKFIEIFRYFHGIRLEPHWLMIWLLTMVSVFLLIFKGDEDIL
jgi:hypothetical protein